MDIEPIKQDIVTASHVLHQQGIAAAFGHVSARIPGTDRFIFPPRMSPALVQIDNLLELDVDGRQLAGAGRPNTEFGFMPEFTKRAPMFSRSAMFIHELRRVEFARRNHTSSARFRRSF